MPGPILSYADICPARCLVLAWHCTAVAAYACHTRLTVLRLRMVVGGRVLCGTARALRSYALALLSYALGRVLSEPHALRAVQYWPMRSAVLRSYAESKELGLLSGTTCTAAVCYRR
eukprot:3328232-Rhodomonas_salina.1